MKIEKLSYVKKRGGGEIEIAFDDGTTLAVDPELAVRRHLREGSLLSDTEMQALRLEQEKLSARRALVRYLSGRKKSRREAQQYLRRKQMTEQAIDYAINAATELELLNDSVYAGAFVRTHERSSAKGPRLIEQELRLRGVSKEIAAQSVLDLSAPDAQRQRAFAVARKKIVLLRGEPETKSRQKLYDFLLRKGYDGDICREVVRELFGETEIGLE